MRRHVPVLMICALGLGIATNATAQSPSHRPDALLAHGFEQAADGPFADAAAARFLAQATFGPTLDGIAHLRTIGYRAWIDEQFAQPRSTQIPYLDWVEGCDNNVTDDTRMEIWSINALAHPIQVAACSCLRTSCGSAWRLR